MKIKKREIIKWIEKLEREFPKVRPKNKIGKEFFKNIEAYKEDAKYFLNKNQLFLSLEAAIWAWAYFKIGKDYGFLE